MRVIWGRNKRLSTPQVDPSMQTMWAVYLLSIVERKERGIPYKMSLAEVIQIPDNLNTSTTGPIVIQNNTANNVTLEKMGQTTKDLFNQPHV